MRVRPLLRRVHEHLGNIDSTGGFWCANPPSEASEANCLTELASNTSRLYVMKGRSDLQEVGLKGATEWFLPRALPILAHGAKWSPSRLLLDSS